jgi:hypothetical protein
MFQQVIPNSRTITIGFDIEKIVDEPFDIKEAAVRLYKELMDLRHFNPDTSDPWFQTTITLRLILLRKVTAL